MPSHVNYDYDWVVPISFPCCCHVVSGGRFMTCRNAIIKLSDVRSRFITSLRLLRSRDAGPRGEVS